MYLKKKEKKNLIRSLNILHSTISIEYVFVLYQCLTQLSNFVGVRVVIVKHPYHVMRFDLPSSQDNHKRTSPFVFLGKI